MTNVPEDSACEEIWDAIKMDGKAVRGHLDELVRSTVEETLNNLLDAEADRLCGAKRYERSTDRVDTCAGSYDRKLETKAGVATCLRHIAGTKWGTRRYLDMNRLHQPEESTE
ncbi:MAG: transposase [Planctomycetota bacterium]